MKVLLFAVLAVTLIGEGPAFAAPTGQTDASSAPAANTAPTTVRVLRTKWSLGRPTGRRRPGKGKANQKAIGQTAHADKVGPALPPPKVQRLPKKRGAAKSTAGRPRKERVNAAPMVRDMMRRRERERDRRY